MTEIEFIQKYREVSKKLDKINNSNSSKLRTEKISEEIMNLKIEKENISQKIRENCENFYALNKVTALRELLEYQLQMFSQRTHPLNFLRDQKTILYGKIYIDIANDIVYRVEHDTKIFPSYLLGDEVGCDIKEIIKTLQSAIQKLDNQQIVSYPDLDEFATSIAKEITAIDKNCGKWASK